MRVLSATVPARERSEKSSKSWRAALRKVGADPFGENASDELTKKKLDELLVRGDPEAAGIVHGAIEEFSQEFALVIRRFLKLKDWKDTQRVVVGGGSAQAGSASS